jgi:hypothetical protein
MEPLGDESGSWDEHFFACWVARCLVEDEMYWASGSDCSSAWINRILDTCLEFMTVAIWESESEWVAFSGCND